MTSKFDFISTSFPSFSSFSKVFLYLVPCFLDQVDPSLPSLFSVPIPLPLCSPDSLQDDLNFPVLSIHVSGGKVHRNEKLEKTGKTRENQENSDTLLKIHKKTHNETMLSVIAIAEDRLILYEPRRQPSRKTWGNWQENAFTYDQISRYNRVQLKNYFCSFTITDSRLNIYCLFRQSTHLL